MANLYEDIQCASSDIRPPMLDRSDFEIGKFRVSLAEDLPKDIYTLSFHYTDAKDIWDNVKMLLEGSKLTKDERESQLYDDFNTSIKYQRRNHLRLLVRVDNNRGQGNYAGEQLQLEIWELNTELAITNPADRTNTFDDDVDEAPVQDLALNKENVFQADQCDAFDYDVDEAPTAQPCLWANLYFIDPIYEKLVHHMFADIPI
ncbi:hypothetical protein Tco_0004142 [Tanacetum coccineum]